MTSVRRGAEISLKRASRRLANGTAGFAAVDALVALVILSGALGLSLVATQSAGKVAAQAARTRQAEALCRYLLATGADEVGVTAGRSSGLDWRLEVKRVSTDSRAPESRLCEASAAVRAPGRGRTFAMATTVVCQAEPSA
jgi:hypothetical protein